MFSPPVESVSAIIPVRNRPELLKDAISSIMCGSVLPSEIIVVIDSCGSEQQDDIAAASSTFNHFSSINITHQILRSEGAGAAAARNLGIKNSSGEWIALLDSDDRWLPDKLKLQLEYLRRRPHLLGCQTLELWRKDGKLLNQPQHLTPRGGFFLKESFESCLISCSSLILHRSCFDMIGYFDESFQVCEDFELWLRYLSHYPLGLVNEPLTEKRSGGWPQLSQSQHSLDELRIKAILKSVREQELSDAEFKAARQACHKKYNILIKGAKRRNRQRELAPLKQEIEATFNGLLSPGL